LDLDNLLKMRNCGAKSAGEILKYVNSLKEIVKENNIDIHSINTFEELGSNEGIKSDDVGQNTGSLDVYKYEDLFEEGIYDSLCEMLSIRSKNALINNNIDTIGKYLDLSRSKFLSFRNAGKSSYNEIVKFQNIFKQLIQNRFNLNSDVIIKSEDFFSHLYSEIGDNGTIKRENTLINDQNIFNTLVQWLDNLKLNSKEYEVFQLRKGLSGSKGMTLEEISNHLGVTRERIRQINNKAENKASNSYRRKLIYPLISYIHETINKNGGVYCKKDIFMEMFKNVDGWERFKYSIPFLDFISIFKEWRTVGLDLKYNDNIYTKEGIKLVEKLSIDIYKLAKENAEEIINDDLWSISKTKLHSVINDWHKNNINFSDNVTLSTYVLDEVLENKYDNIIISGDVIYSMGLYNIRFGRLSDTAIAILKSAKGPMHYSDIYKEYKILLPSEDDIKERNIAANLDRADGVLLWGRGTYIHISNIKVQKDLIDNVSKWIYDELKKNIPFMSILKAYINFKFLCNLNGITNEVALYFLLKYYIPKNIVFSHYPYVYKKESKIPNLTLAPFIEQYIYEANAEVKYQDLKNIVLNKLGFKDFQWANLIYNSPNIIRTNNNSFIHVDNINIDKNILSEIVSYTLKVVKREKHISVNKIFNEKIITCKMLGINGPNYLYSLFRVYASDKLDLSEYPKIAIYTNNEGNKGRHLRTEIVDYIKNYNAPCSYQELENIFVKNRGYREESMYLISNSNELIRYSPGCFIHKETIGLDNVIENNIYNIAYKELADARTSGKIYGDIRILIENYKLPKLRNGILWTETLLSELIKKSVHFKIMGTTQYIYIDNNNERKIDCFADFIYYILKDIFMGATNLNELEKYLIKIGTIKNNIPKNIFDNYNNMRKIGNEIFIAEILNA